VCGLKSQREDCTFVGEHQQGPRNRVAPVRMESSVKQGEAWFIEAASILDRQRIT
jgi:hypothetical protein